MTLSMVNLSGTAGAVGDKYTGLDRFGRVVDQRWTQGTTPTSAVVDRYGYTYDRNSNRLTRSNALAAAFSERYSYDALNQLQSLNRTGSATVPPIAQTWSFDALGNWAAVTTNSVAQNRTANAQNEVTQVGTATLTYSLTGNLANDEQGRTLVYDGWNRLVSVRNTAGTEIARYEYDGLNRRIVEQVGAPAAPDASKAPVRDIYYSQDWQVIEERVRSSLGMIPGSASTRFIWSPVYVDALIARDARSGARTTARPAAGTTDGMDQRVYALQDANWNTTAIVSAGGVAGVAANTVFHRFVYTPYGEWQILTSAWTALAAGTTAATPWSHLFQGLDFTVMTGLSHARNRDYSASLGRFIKLDPIGFNAGDNNWYRFVANQPTKFVDPSGLEKIWFEFNGFIPANHGNSFATKHLSDNNVDGTWIWAPDGWYYATDNRGFGGGTSRVFYRGWIESTAIGKVRDGDWNAKRGTSGSTRVSEVRSTTTPGGWDISKQQKNSHVQGSAQVFNSGTGTTIRLTASGGDPFLEPLAPNLDFTVSFAFEYDCAAPNKVRVSINDTRDAYPNYEAIVTTTTSSLNRPIRGTSLYEASASYNGFRSLALGLPTTVLFGSREKTIDATTPR